MELQIILRQATQADIPQVMEIIAHAREQMRLRGSLQWQGAYPAPQDIAHDIETGEGYVLDRDGRVAAYGAVVFDGEPAYAFIDGAWPNGNPYVVVHRLAVAASVARQGLATLFMQRVETLALRKGVRDFRVDTNFDNLYMQKMLANMGFTYCGEIMYEGDKRLAYHKSL